MSDVSDAFKSILKRLHDREVVLPLLETAMRRDDWPDRYHVEIDSSPYYGRGDGYFHPSSHPLLPARRLYYQMHPVHRQHLIAEPWSMQSMMTLNMGSALHAVLQTQMRMAGLVREENIEKEFVDPVHHVRGRVDMVVDVPTEGELLCEIKTRTSFLYSKTVDPLPSWVAQVSIQLDNLDMDRGIVIMVESGFPYRIQELPIRRDDKLLDEIYAKFDAVREAVQRDTPPDLRQCCGLDTPEMQKCPARGLCWGG